MFYYKLLTSCYLVCVPSLVSGSDPLGSCLVPGLSAVEVQIQPLGSDKGTSVVKDARRALTEKKPTFQSVTGGCRVITKVL